MNKWVIRGLFFVLLLASVDPIGLLRARAERGADIETTVRYLLARDGMTYRGIKNDGVLKSLLFDWPLCSKPLQVVPAPRTFDSNTLLKAVGEPGDIHYFAYLSRASAHETRFSFFLEHLKHSALGLIAMTPYQADGMMLMISEPKGCKAAPRVDWSLAWQTNYRLRVARDPDPSPQKTSEALPR
jgi:hypothetical protein